MGEIQLAAYFMSQDSETLISSVQAAEEAGYAVAYLNDSTVVRQDPYVHMTMVLDRTRSIVVGSGVTNFVTRDFTVVANAHATLAGLHPGRVLLGVGRGDTAVHSIGLSPMPPREFGKAVRHVRRLLRGEFVEPDGRKAFKLKWLDGAQVPVMVGATGPRTLQIAGAVADVVQLEVGVHPDAIRWAIEQVHRGAEKAGRNPAELRLSVINAMWVADDEATARARCRWSAVSAADQVEAAMRFGGHGMPEALTRVVMRRREAMSHYSSDSHLDNDGPATEFLTDDLVDDFAIAGTPETCLSRIRALARLGVHELAAGFFNGEQEQLDRVGRDVIARLKESGEQGSPRDIPGT